MIAFNYGFPTYNHPRYIGGYISALYILGLISLCIIFTKKHALIFSGTLLVLCFVSNYITFDPLSLLVMDKHNTGENLILSTKTGMYPFDGMVYNKQYSYWDRCIVQLMNDLEPEDRIVLNEDLFFLSNSFIDYYHLDFGYEAVTIVDEENQWFVDSDDFDKLYDNGYRFFEISSTNKNGNGRKYRYCGTNIYLSEIVR